MGDRELVLHAKGVHPFSQFVIDEFPSPIRTKAFDFGFEVPLNKGHELSDACTGIIFVPNKVEPMEPGSLVYKREEVPVMAYNRADRKWAAKVHVDASEGLTSPRLRSTEWLLGHFSHNTCVTMAVFGHVSLEGYAPNLGA
jgi:hypothetical protein